MNIEDTNTTPTGKLENQKVYDKTGSVKIPKMQILKELHSDTRTSPVYLVKFDKKNDANRKSSDKKQISMDLQ